MQTHHFCVRKALLSNYLTLSDDGRSISRNIDSLNILIHELTNLLCYQGLSFTKSDL